MTDIVDSQRRSELMEGIRGHNTAPEMTVRRIAHRMGLRFRLHRKDLPGRPDLVLSKHRIAVFAHGCFWHRHEGCRDASTPKSRVAFWTTKFEANVVRDVRQQAALRALGWQVLVIWQCETRDEAVVEYRLAVFIDRGRAAAEHGSTPSATMREVQGSAPGIEVLIRVFQMLNGADRGSGAADASAPSRDEQARPGVVTR